MKPSVYVETTIVSYLTAKRPTDVIRQAQQEVTKKWWRERRRDFSLFTSQFVLEEASAGDPEAASQRRRLLGTIRLLEIAPEVVPLAERLLKERALPRKAEVDALHLAVATVNGMEYLVTWNCKHLANAVLWPMIEVTCRSAGYQPPTICTPFELLGGES